MNKPSEISKRYEGVLDFSESTLNRTILTLALPAILEYLLFTAIRLTDTFIVGHLHDEIALAAVGLAGPLIFFSISPFFALSVSATALIARRWGEGRLDEGRNLAGQFMGMAFIGALITMFLGMVLANKFMVWMGAENTVADQGAMYYRIVLISSLTIFPLFVGNGILRGAGDTKTPMINTAIMNVVNIIFSLGLAFGIGPLPKLGLAGVAWGTVAGQTTAFFFMMHALISSNRQIRMKISGLNKWRKSDVNEIFNLGWPVFVERYFSSGSFIIFIGIVSILGTAALGANNIAIRVESIAFMPAIGLSFAMTSIVGQALGAKQISMGKLAVRKALIAAGTVMIVLGVIFFIFAENIVGLFGATPNVLRLSAIAVRISAFELPFIAIGMILAGCLRGAGDTKSPLIVMVICIIIFRFGLVYLLGIKMNLGLGGVWLGTACDWAGRSIGLGVVFFRKSWIDQ
jgi:putative MATE family efflux protein